MDTSEARTSLRRHNRINIVTPAHAGARPVVDVQMDARGRGHDG